MKNPRKLVVLKRKKCIVKGKHTLILLGPEEEECSEVTHVHIDNHVTKKSSVTVPLSAIKELLKGEL
jgi:hypothetical protein